MKKVTFLSLFFLLILILPHPVSADTLTVSNLKVVGQTANGFMLEFDTNIPSQMDVLFSTTLTYDLSGTRLQTSYSSGRTPLETYHKVMVISMDPLQTGTKIYYQLWDYANQYYGPIQEYIIPSLNTIAISNLSVQPTQNGAIFNWDTSVPTTTELYLTQSTSNSLNYSSSWYWSDPGFVIKNDRNLTTTHSVQVSGLQSDKAYVFGIFGFDSNNNFVFYAKHFWTITDSGYQIFGLKYGTLTKNSAGVGWYSNFMGNNTLQAYIEYGTTTNYGNQVVANCKLPADFGGNTGDNLNTDLYNTRDANCGIVLENLLPDTTYHFRAKIGSVISEDKTFKTYPDISQPQPTPIPEVNTDYLIRNVIYINSTNQIIWAWDTNSIPTNAFVDYGLTNSYGQKSIASCNQIKNGYGRNCSATVAGLSAKTNYHFRINNGSVIGDDILQPTLGATQPPSKPIAPHPYNEQVFKPVEVNAFNSLDWTVLENPGTIKFDVYLKLNSFQFTELDKICQNLTTNLCKISPLQAGTYFWKVVALDPSTNLKTTSDTWEFTLQAAQSSSTSTTPPTTPTTTQPTTAVTNFVLAEKALVTNIDTSLVNRVNGYILLQVQNAGQAWYVDPISDLKYYLPDGSSAYTALRKFGLGITNADLAKIPVGIESRFQDTDSDNDGLPDNLEVALGTNPQNSDSDGDGYSDLTEVQSGYNPMGSGKLSIDTTLANRLKGRIVLQVQAHGEAWYINPKDGKRYYMKDGGAAYQIMRYLSLGITNTDLRKIPVGSL